MVTLTVAVAGRGNVASSLVPALAGAGHRIVKVNPHSPQDDLPGDIDVCVLAVKDDVIKGVARRIAAVTDCSRMIMAHTAGSVPMDVFDGIVPRYGVIYPLQTFSKERPLSFNDVPCFVEASDDEALHTLCALAASICGWAYIMSSDRRRYLHLAAVFACNFVNHCYDLADSIMSQAGLSYSFLLPLIDETARKVHELSPREAQTGPAVRYDTNVIDKHLELLRSEPHMADIYRLMSKSIHDKLRP